MASTDYGTVWVCWDCYYTHHYGARLHDGQWYVGDSDSPSDRVPLGQVDGFTIHDATCSDHIVDHLYDADGDRTGDYTDCPNCGSNDMENGLDEFSWRNCEGCGSRLGGARYRLSLWKDHE